jgi:glycosyltransferase involved in cell wall biosynthesis
MTARVSVVIPVFNGERFFADALASLESEKDIPAEFIIVDDGSTDGSMAIAKGFADRDPRFRIVRGPHQGVAAARNTGVDAAGGEYVTFLDCDDLCPPGRIARQTQKLESHGTIEVVLGQTLWFEALTQDLQPVPGTRFLRNHCVALHSALFRRSVFETYGTFDETAVASEDLDFFLRLYEGGARVLVENDIASLYRRHAGNMTNNQQLLQRSVLAALQKSLVRRRASGCAKPIDGFFTRRFALDTAASPDPTKRPA